MRIIAHVQATTLVEPLEFILLLLAYMRQGQSIWAMKDLLNALILLTAARSRRVGVFGTTPIVAAA